MPTYRVRYDYTVSETGYIDVEAEDESSAEDAAFANVWEDDINIYDVEEI